MIFSVLLPKRSYTLNDRQKKTTFSLLAVADPRGAWEIHTPALGQDFFIFMQVLGENGQIIGWHPPQGLAHPPLGNPVSATD